MRKRKRSRNRNRNRNRNAKPIVLWRIFSRKRVRSLSETILSLVPKNCDCKSRGKCLHCVFGNGGGGSKASKMTYLIRADDPSDYLELMNSCFVVIPTEAPPLPPFLRFSRRWSQLQIVERTIDTILSKNDEASNVLCSGYQKFKLTSSIVKLLTSSAWDLMLERVGDCLMHHLLLHNLIFVAINSKTHQQVAGPPVNQFCPRNFCSPYSGLMLSPSYMQAGHERKRRKCHGNDCACEDPPTNIVLKAGQQKSSDCVCTHTVQGSSLTHVTTVAKTSDDDGLHLDDVLESRSSEKLHKTPRKRLRLPSWQRRKRRKILMLQGICNQVFDKEDNSDKTLQHGSVNNQFQGDMMPTSDKLLNNKDGANLNSEQLIPLLCPCCLVFQSLPPVPKDAYINRKSMFYNLESSSSLFPKNNVFHRLKRGASGANNLLRRILGLSSVNALSLPASCSHHHHMCSHGSPCLYHSLIKLLRDLVDRVKRCQHMRLLENCSIQSSSGFAERDADSVPQSSKDEMVLSSSKQVVSQEVNWPLNRSFLTGLSNCKRASEVIPHEFGVSRPYCRKGEVESFVWDVCRKIVPRDLLGGPSNQRILRRKISRFIKLRRFEKFSLRQCIHKLDISKFPRLLSIQSKCFNAFAFKHGLKQTSEPVPRFVEKNGHYGFKQILIERWIVWLFAHVVVPLIRANFYVTESEHGKQNVYYYRKSVWKKLTNTVITKQLEAGNYHPLDDKSLRGILKERSFGFSRVRFCPKKTGARPIANLKAPSRLPSVKFDSYPWSQEKERRAQSSGTEARPIGNLKPPSKLCCVRLCACARFPKEKRKARSLQTGSRPTANLKAPSRRRNLGSHFYDQFKQKKRKGQSCKSIYRASYFKAVNTVLRDLHVVFKDLRTKEPEKWGSSVSSYDDIYEKLLPFLKNLKNGQSTMPLVYVVVTDVDKAFDTVNQDKLLTIVNELQMADKYTLKMSYEILCRRMFLWISKNQKLVIQGVDNKFGEMMPSICQKSRHSIYVDQEHTKHLKREDIKFILEEHLKRNVLNIGRRFFLQAVGISQGSVLSSLLCSLYYGHLERNVIFPYLAKGANDNLDHHNNGVTALGAVKDASSLSAQCLLLRYVDDFFFLSTSKKQAALFFSRLRRGFQAYNCHMNQEKFCTNFDVGSMSGLGTKRLLVGSDGASYIRWSGLLINSYSLEVQADYTRYLNNHLGSTLTVNWPAPDHHLRTQLYAYMRPKCHPLFFDVAINSPSTIRLNVYQAFVLCAMKFHCHICELSTWCKLCPKYCFICIKKSIRYMFRLMWRRMRHINPDSLGIASKEVAWLGLNAYVRVLKKKQSRYKKLLRLLRDALRRYSWIGSSPELRYAVDDSHSSYMWKIKY